MTEQEGLGGMARRWLRAKATELLTTDRRERENAAAVADRAEQDANDQMVEQAVFTAFPGLQRMRDQQEAAQQQRHADEHARILALPRAQVQLTVNGQVADGAWAGELPVRVDRHEQLFTVELVVPEGSEPDVGGKALRGATVAAPGFQGDGSYDLAAAAQRAEADEDPLDPMLWCVRVGGDDEALCWVPEVGAGAVDVADGGAAVMFRARMTGATGDADVVLRLTNLPPARVAD